MAGVVVAAVTAGWAGGSSLAATRSVCLQQTRTAIAKDLAIKAGAVSTTAIAQASNGMPQCTFKAGRVSVIVNVDNGPQPVWRLMRKVVEATQIFGPPPPGWKAPIGLFGLGPEASWFPNLDAMMANNDARTELLTVTVSWKHAKQAAMRKLARAALIPYIHARAKSHPIPVNGY